MFSPLLTCVDAFRPSQQPPIVLPVVPVIVAQPSYQPKAKCRHPGFFTSSQLQHIHQNCSKATTRGEGKGNQKGGLGFVSYLVRRAVQQQQGLAPWAKLNQNKYFENILKVSRNIYEVRRSISGSARHSETSEPML